MILDALTMLSNGQALTAGTTASTDKYDLGDVTPRRHIGDGEQMAIVVTVDVAAVVSADTFDFQVVTDEDSALGSPTVHLTRRIAGALLVAGAMIVLPIPAGIQEHERYLGARFILGASDTLTVSAHIVPMNFIARLPKSYASGFTFTP